MTYTVTVYIAAPKTPLKSGGTSVQGHMWYTTYDSTTNELKSFGFAPLDKKTNAIPAVGEVYKNDHENYAYFEFSRIQQISSHEFQMLNRFGNNYESMGFSKTYWAPTNSCVDFVWKALELAGLNSSRYQGSVFPVDNIQDIKNRMNLSPVEIQQLSDLILKMFPLSGDSAEGLFSLDKLIKTFNFESNTCDKDFVDNSGIEQFNGGAGKDTYQLQNGDSDIDILKDGEGQDQIKVNGVPVQGVFMLQQDGSNNYYTNDDRYQLEELDAATHTWRLSVQDTATGNYNGVADLEDWTSGDYGLTLDAALPAEPERVTLIESASAAYMSMDASGVVTEGVHFEGGSKSDSFTGTPYGDVVLTGNGLHHMVTTWSGDDMVVGGDGREYIRTGANSPTNLTSDNDIAFGGTGSDVLLGGGGEDQLVGDYDNGEWETAGSDERGDWLSGEHGNDALTGSNRSDVLFGGSGEDILKGGAGRDLLVGDAQYTPYSKATALPYSVGLTQSYIWNSNVSDMTRVSEANYGMYPVMVPSGNAFSWTWSAASNGDFSVSNPAGLSTSLRIVTTNGGADWLDGGDGDDWMAGQTGDDQVHGGNGNDYLHIGTGGDLLHGDAGNDGSVQDCRRRQRHRKRCAFGMY